MNNYTPIPFREGNTLLEVFTKPFEDRVGNKATITYANYIDKKKVLRLNYVLYVEWLREERL